MPYVLTGGEMIAGLGGAVCPMFRVRRRANQMTGSLNGASLHHLQPIVGSFAKG
jgi:hypothetical protein